MKKWIILWIAALCLTLLLASCGKDPAVTPDADLPSEDPVADADSTPEDPVEDTTPAEDTTPPVEEVQMPFISGADYVGFIDYAYEEMGYPPFEFDGEFDSIKEGRYYSVFTENPNPDRYMDPNGGCITMVLTAEGRLARLHVEFAADTQAYRVINVAVSPFDDDYDETRKIRYVIEDFLEAAMQPDAEVYSEAVHEGMVIHFEKGFDGVLPMCFTIEAEGVKEFMDAHLMDAHPIEG